MAGRENKCAPLARPKNQCLPAAVVLCRWISNMSRLILFQCSRHIQKCRVLDGCREPRVLTSQSCRGSSNFCAFDETVKCDGLCGRAAFHRRSRLPGIRLPRTRSGHGISARTVKCWREMGSCFSEDLTYEQYKKCLSTTKKKGRTGRPLRFDIKY